jgi:hypothetical protein
MIMVTFCRLILDSAKEMIILVVEKEKELDDFTKSLGKQMNLVMYRMEDTERVRYQLRERRRQEVREKAARDEEKEKNQMERMERNRNWRERKNGEENLGSISEERILDEKEERKQKNIEWRKRKESRNTSFQMCEYGRETSESLSLASFLLPLLECPYCQEEMSPPAIIYQCREGHNLCTKCKNVKNMTVRITNPVKNRLIQNFIFRSVCCARQA